MGAPSGLWHLRHGERWFHVGSIPVIFALLLLLSVRQGLAVRAFKWNSHTSSLTSAMRRC